MNDLEKESDELVNHFMSKGATVSKHDFDRVLKSLDRAYEHGVHDGMVSQREL
jgi:hypothetical protein